MNNRLLLTKCKYKRVMVYVCVWQHSMVDVLEHGQLDDMSLSTVTFKTL